MNAPTVAAVLAVGGVLAVPVAATGRVIPSKHQVRPAARVLCICVEGPPAQPPESDVQFELDIDQSLIAHGLDPIYGTSTASPPSG
jgi:hypothetical protein